MKVCLVGYVDNTEENKRMLDTYEFKNDFWAENFKFRRRDRQPLADGELEMVSNWIDREIIKKHRTNWLSEKHPAYVDITDAEVLKKYWPWMPDDEIKQRLDHEAHMKAIAKEFPPEEFRRQYLSEPLSAKKNRELELEFKG